MKIALYRLAKFLGFFLLTRWIFRRRLLILCYHGFEVDDEADFMPGVFMRGRTFAARMRTLAEGGYNVLPLATALQRMREGSLPTNTVCLTLDDGFKSVHSIGLPVLRRHGFASTLYATTYYIEKEAPVFRLVVQYMFWKSGADVVELRGRSWRSADLIAWAEQSCTEAVRQELCRELGEALGVDYEHIVASRMFGLMTPVELEEVERAGMDVQLHTHRHRFPDDTPEQAGREIIDNARCLKQWLGKQCTHFCYPSGEWRGQHLYWLQQFGISSATTCDRGFNHGKTHPFALYRALDSEAITPIEFEAEICGFGELLRIVSGRRYRAERLRKVSAPQEVPASATAELKAVFQPQAFVKESSKAVAGEEA